MGNPFRIGRFAREEVLPAFVDLQGGVLPVVEPRALHVLVFEREAEGLYQMERRAGVGAEADDVAGIGRNFGMNENDVEHDGLDLRNQKGSWPASFSPILRMASFSDRKSVV